MSVKVKGTLHIKYSFWGLGKTIIPSWKERKPTLMEDHGLSGESGRVSQSFIPSHFQGMYHLQMEQMETQAMGNTQRQGKQKWG